MTADFGIFVEFVRSDVIHREDDLNIVLLRFFDQSPHLF